MGKRTVTPASEPSPRPAKGAATLVSALVAIAAIWCLVLPRIARLPSVAERQRRLDEAGIDPSAMYYTDLDMMEPLLRELESR